MKKALNRIFSQTTVVVLLLLLQLFVFFSFTLRIVGATYYAYISGLVRLVSVAVMIYLINVSGSPEVKLAWVIQMCIFPLVGTFLYLYVQAQSAPIRFNKTLRRLRLDVSSHAVQDLAVVDALDRIEPQKANLVRYMNARADAVCYDGADVRYYPLGEQAWQALLEELEKAEKYIFMEFFIIGEGEMWRSILDVLARKAAAGVDVRLMYDGMGCLTRLPHSYPKEMEKLGIRCRVFNSFKPFLSTIQNNRDHRKIVVVDGKTAFTGGVNLSDEYVNITHPFGHWKDTAVIIRGEAAYSFALMFLELWQMAGRETEPDCSQFRPEELAPAETEGWVMPFGDSPLDDELVGETVYLDVITKARRYVHITSPYMIIDHNMMTALGGAAKSGVDVRIIVPSVADHWYAHAVARAYYAGLLSRGVKVYEYTPGFIHSKSFVSDGDTAVVGTINMDYRSLYLHFECAAWLYRHPAVQEIEDDFQATLARCRPITEESCRDKGIKKLLYAILRLFAPLM